MYSSIVLATTPHIALRARTTMWCDTGGSKNVHQDRRRIPWRRAAFPIKSGQTQQAQGLTYGGLVCEVCSFPLLKCQGGIKEALSPEKPRLVERYPRTKKRKQASVLLATYGVHSCRGRFAMKYTLLVEKHEWVGEAQFFRTLPEPLLQSRKRVLRRKDRQNRACITRYVDTPLTSPQHPIWPH